MVSRKGSHIAAAEEEAGREEESDLGDGGLLETQVRAP